MELNQITNPTLPSSTPTALSDPSGVLGSDFEVFLQMLTAQAQYQDPLEPMDNSEYAAQLAQFSMVEQQVMTNDLMEQLMTTLGANNMSSAANWIGMEALVQGPVQYDGTPVTISPNPPITADQVDLIVSNAQGKEVQRIQIPTSSDPFSWTGLNASGNPLPNGEYTFEIESSAQGEVLITEPALSYSRVTEARIEEGETLLVLESGYMITANNVAGLREPG
ncbi:MAG: flagellar hook capping FlgD N-terminal domain-containing protein [Tateyamaria sp.]|jgi:flagellar basal-body rod modification protein FlgD|nr:flagellar hook capping FlgD N-terminal domain-containing protein [Tateyamaria sp.]MDG1335256.1 flagellar hook capping FlgD N-terminal domain-containing protein [Tateyamaria sp.]MDG2056113.1 flagellar hook capping FlgD N-terminal domain-containing protein [Tateyamaria sp.]